MNTQITVAVTISAPVEKVWEIFNNPADIMSWNTASAEWHTPKSENNLKVGGTFSVRMEAKDGSAGFDLTGTYTEVIPSERIAYTMEDGRKVEVSFESVDSDNGPATKITETFDAEIVNQLELQKMGWQAILDNLKAYVENK